MGLDAYFYRRLKRKKESSVPSSAEWASILANASDITKELLTRMSAYADMYNYSLSEVLNTAMKEFLYRYESYDDEIVYFRKFHFLNDYFNYTDENYAKDMLVTKDQCIELRDRAKACLDECNSVPATLAFNAYNKHSYEDVRNDVCNKHFQSEWGDSYYEKVRDLYKSMTDIINNTDWDIECIVYNADW